MELVMLHGLLGGPENWKGVIPYLPVDCIPLTPRLPYFDKEITLTNITSMVEYVQGYLNGKGSDQFVLLGNSLGGHIACLLAVKLPKRAVGLVLTGSSGLLERGFSRIPGVHPKREWIAEKCREVFYDDCHATEEIVQSVWDIINDRHKVRILVQHARSAKRDNIARTLEQIACPTLLIWGKQDQITPPEVAREFQDKIPNSELFWLDKCGHAPMIEHPEEFGRTVSRWWKNQGLT